jgi:hypothetical protein
VTNSSYFEKIYAELEKLDRVDVLTGAIYRKRAQEILADSKVALKVRQTVAELLSQANRRMTISSIASEESY